MKRDNRKFVDRIEEYCRKVGGQRRWALLRKGGTVLAWVGTICVLLWYAGSESLWCDRNQNEIHCHRERTHWLGQVSASSQAIPEVTGIEVKGSLNWETNDTYFLQGRIKTVRLELLNWNDVQRLQAFFAQPTETCIIVQRSTFANIFNRPRDCDKSFMKTDF